MAELINRNDSLNDGREKLNDSIMQSERAEDKSDEALGKANQSLDKSENTQTQLDQVVIEGDSSVEAAQARVDAENNTFPTLKARLDAKETETSTQLAQTAPFLNNGKLVLPSDFPKYPFNVFKNKYGDWYSDATAYNQFDWTDATDIFIVSNGSSVNDGLTPDKSTTLSNFRDNFNNGMYGQRKKFVLKLLEFVYVSNGNNSLILDIDADILIESASASNISWLGRVKSSKMNNLTSDWIYSDDVYKTTQTNDHDVLDVVNLTVLDDFKMPSIYIKKSTLLECKATKGSFFRDGVDCYCNPLDNHDIDDIILVIGTSVISLNQSHARIIMFSNIGFLPSSYQAGTINNLNARAYMFGCKFHRATQNGLYLDGQYNVHSFDCVVSYPTLDAFNYHTNNPNSLATEVNGIGFAPGKHKMLSGQPTHSNNGSTAHDGMNMLRVGCRYYDCEGPIVADADNCYSISIGCEASGILDSTTGVRAAFYMYDKPDDTPETSKPKYIIECKGYGENVEEGVRGTAKTYVANFIGNQNFSSDVQRGVEEWN